MFLYNILTGGSSKQQLPKYDKISFKINLSDNIPQFYQCTPSQSNKPYQYQQQEQLTQSHPMYNKIIKSIMKNETNQKRKNSLDQKQNIKQSSSSLKNINQSNSQSNKQYQNDDQINEQQKNQFKKILKKQQQPEQVQIEQYDQPLQNSPHNNYSQSEQQSSPHPYHIYTTTQNDSLFGIALKLDIRQQQIQQLNGIGQSLYPGMRIKLPYHCDVSKLYQQPESQLSKVKISELLGIESGTSTQTQKFIVEYYAGLAGYIKGTLSINNNYIIFNPQLQDKSNLQNYSIQKLLKFNAIVETMDIQSIQFIDIPQMGDTQSKIQNPDHNFIIQIFLYIVGNPKIQRKYKQRLTKLKAQKKAIASISFSLRGYKNQAKSNCQKIINKVKTILKKFQQQENQSDQGYKVQEKSRDQKHLTNIPFFDIIHENLHPRMKQQIQSIVLTPQKSGAITIQPVSPSLACGILTQTSDIISDAMFHNLSCSLPLLYQQCNWTRIYSSTLNGTSFTTFLNKSRGQYPLILLVKEYKGWKFGAYLCQSLQTGKTGRGQMFLFTFKNDSQVPDTYKWTTKNEFFVYIQKDSGIGIGMGVKYGLFVRNTMDKGSSSATFTFGNTQSLSKKEDFIVQQVQLWTVDNGY